VYSFFTSTGEEMFCTDCSPQFLNTGFVMERVLCTCFGFMVPFAGMILLRLSWYDYLRT